MSALSLDASHPPLRDLWRTMVLPYFAVENRRTEKIVFKSKGIYLEVIPGEGEGVPTIHDLDFLIVIVSMLNEQDNRYGQMHRCLEFSPAAVLRNMRRHTSGSDYQRLARTIRRLRTATIITNVFDELGDGWQRPFGWVSDYKVPITHLGLESDSFGTTHADGNRKWSVTISENLIQSISTKTELLAIHPRYFDLRSGIERALYRIARKSVGDKQGQWRWTVHSLHKICALKSPIHKFRYKLKLIEQTQCLPEYDLNFAVGSGDNLIVFTRNLEKPLRPKMGFIDQ